MVSTALCRWFVSRSHADDANRDFVGRRGLAVATKQTTGQNRRQNERGPGGFQKLTAVEII
jgi:hypothetical protein